MNATIMILLIVVPTIFVIVISFIAANKQKKIKGEIEEDIKKGNFEQVKIKQKTSQKKISKLIGTAVLLPILSTGVILFFTIGGCSSDATISILVLEKENEKYVFHGNSFFLENSIKREEVVDISSYSKFTLYPLKEGYYVDPADLESIAAFATGQYEIVEYDQGSHAGFVVVSDSILYTTERTTVPTDKIGKTINLETITISDGEKELVVEYKIDGFDRIAIRNCEVKSVWEMTNPYPGKTVGDYRDKLLVNATEVMRYFNPNAKIEFTEDKEILLIRLE